MVNICEMTGVREYDEGFPVALERDDETGRPIVVAMTEGGFRSTKIDALDLIEWLNSDAGRVALAAASPPRFEGDN